MPFLTTLFDFDFWANRQLLEACLKLTPEQFARPFSMGQGSIERTASHLVSSLFFYADRLKPTRYVARFDDDLPSSAVELLAHYTTAESEFRAAVQQVAATHDLDDTFWWTRDGQPTDDPLDSITYSVALSQMIEHGIHHRTQCMDMLGLLGLEPKMDWHPFEWDEAQRRKDKN